MFSGAAKSNGRSGFAQLGHGSGSGVKRDRRFLRSSDDKTKIFDHAIVGLGRLTLRREIVADEDRIRDIQAKGQLTQADFHWFVQEVVKVHWADVNLDRRVDSRDLLQIFQSGKYEAGPSSALWSEGDWNCDGALDSADLVRLFQSGSYQGS